MTPEAIAEAAAEVIEACRKRAQQTRDNTFVARMLIEPQILAACVAAHLANPATAVDACVKRQGKP